MRNIQEKKIASVPNLYRLFSLSLFPRQDRVTTIYILFAYQEVLQVEPSEKNRRSGGVAGSV